jgi:hypothetical protein
MNTIVQTLTPEAPNSDTGLRAGMPQVWKSYGASNRAARKRRRGQVLGLPEISDLQRHPSDIRATGIKVGSKIPGEALYWHGWRILTETK